MHAVRLVALGLLVLPALRASDYRPAQAAPADAYADFDAFCADNFGAEGEEEMYRRFGESLAFDAAAHWVHASERSAVIGWGTSLPARGRIEHGATTSYGLTTELDPRPFAVHLGYLTGLPADTTWHYRLLATDERGNTIASPDRTLETRTISGAVHVPDDVSGPPYVLDKAGGTYVVTADIVAPSTAFNIAADDITLDLGGHTVTYDNVAGSPDPIGAGNYGANGTRHPCGIRTGEGNVVRLFNGVVRQGAGAGGSDPTGFNPVFMRRPRQSEVAGLTVDYQGAQVTGILLDSSFGGSTLHHNVVRDRGTEIDDRHAGSDGLGGLGGGEEGLERAVYNLLARVRHRGIRAGIGTEVEGNEIYVDSWATNSYGVLYYSSDAEHPVSDVVVRGNRIFGTGYHPIGVGAGFHARNVTVEGNYIQMQGQAPSGDRWPGGPGDPEGQDHPVNGVRFHKGPQTDIAYRDNTIVVKARGTAGETALMRGLWVTPADGAERCVFEDNRVKQVAQNAQADGHAVAALGTDPDDPTNRITYTNNVIMSNTANVRFGDSYGHGGRHDFVSNTLVRLGDDARYKTIKFGWLGWNFPSYGHRFVDSLFEGGASYSSLAFEGALGARYDFTVAWTLIVHTDPGAHVLVRDIFGGILMDELTEAGEARIALDAYLRYPGDQTTYTPHAVAVANPDCVGRLEAVTMDQVRELWMGCDGLPGTTATPNGGTPVPSATPSPTSSVTSAPSGTAPPGTATGTPTASSTTTPGATPEPSATATQTAVFTPTPTHTATHTPTHTTVPTATSTPTATIAPTASGTSTGAASPAPSAPPTATGGPSVTGSPIASASSTPGPSATPPNPPSRTAERTSTDLPPGTPTSPTAPTSATSPSDDTPARPSPTGTPSGRSGVRVFLPLAFA